MFTENHGKNLRSLSAIFAVTTLIGFFLSAAPFIIEAAPGDLDPTFGNGGKVITDFNNSSEQANAIAVQSDGKIVVVGYSSNPQTYASDFALARYNTDGTLDASFGTGGKVTTHFGYRQEYAEAVVIQADGKIVAVGVSGEDSPIGYDFTLARYNTDGSLDTSFGVGGKVRTNINWGDAAYAASLQPDGKIVVAGSSASINGDDFFALARYNTDGTLDASFGTGGLVTTNVSNSEEQAYAVALQADAKIVVAGYARNASSDFALVRYNTNGTLDTSFGAGGKVITDFNGRSERAEDVAIQSDGKIIAVGSSYSSNPDTGSFALARYNTDGSLDTSFGADGKVVNPTTEVFSASAVAIQANGKIIVAGRVGFPDIKFALTRYNTNGSFDTTFGTGGTVTTNISSGYDIANAVVIQPDGKIIAAGLSVNPQNNTGDFALVRYLGDAATRPTQFDFDGDGKADISVFRPDNGTWYLNQSASGFAGVQFGAQTDKIVPADYDGDGKTDVAVYRNGIWYLQRSSAGFTGVAFGEATDIPVSADYDGDGKADVAVFRPSNGTWYLLQSNLGFTGIQFGQAGDKPVAADYDGDSKADIAVYRNGTWYIQRSQLGFTGIAFGTSEDKPVPADYDGDGKADVAVFRPSNGTWYLQRSQLGFAGITFGLETDLPVPADYDGDGKADVAVFRQSDGTWYLQRSQAGFTGVAFGSSNDKPIPNAFVP